MKQAFKTIYYPSLRDRKPVKRSVTLAFGETDVGLHTRVKSLTSLEIRTALGHATYEDLERAAQTDNRPISSYCTNRLRQVFKNGQDFQFVGRPAVEAPAIDGIQATFRGGAHEPLHDWYPYLEGYSPQFVENVLRHFAPAATAVIDPFAGVGTTPITAARMGIRSYYCELNPLLQYLIDTKVAALSLDAKARVRLAGEINDFRRDFPRFLRESQADFDLQCSYGKVFGNSRFFDEAVFDSILRARCLVDWLRCESPLLGTFIEWAVLSSLIPASRLIRRGDLRFKNEDEMTRPKQDLFLVIDNVLRMIELDIQRVETIAIAPKCLCLNARQLSKLLPVEADCVITSPPYLNGTNYFRNTKIELWFIRALRNENDLRAYRNDAITAGINDVTLSESMRLLTPEIHKVVADIQAHTYDKRIPKMVADYFVDMAEVFGALRPHLKPNARLAIDIGDSRYNDVHVPTDNLLAGVLSELGYEKQTDIVLRQRCSRNGQPLKQVLLIFDVKNACTVKEMPAHDYASWVGLWREFKKELPHHAQPYCKRNWGHPLHSLCSYQGKLKPALAHFLIRTFVPEGGTILDPFAGVGTISFEAALTGRKSWSFDISPAALLISRAKLSNPRYEDCLDVLNTLTKYIAAADVDERDRISIRDVHFNGRLQDYFHSKTLTEVLLARRYFLENRAVKDSESFVLSALLHILHGNRPYALSRRSHPITPFAPTGPAEYRALIPRLAAKVHRTFKNRLPSNFVRGEVYDQDAIAWWPPEIQNLDAIVTSPPFFDSTRFYLANWMRLWFCGWDARDFRVKPLAYVDERQKHDINVYRPFFRQARERLKPAGLLVLHLGKSRKCDMAKCLQLVAHPWFRSVDLFEESVAHCESHGIADKGTVEKHQFLVLGR